MELKRFNIELDIKKRNFNELFQVVQGDYDTNVLEIQLYNDTTKYDLTDLIVEIAFRKADGTTVVQTETSGVSIISAFDGKIECVLKTNTIAAIGRVTAEVRVLGTENKLLTSTTFDFIVREAIVSDETIESTNEFPVLTEMVNTVNQITEEVTLLHQETTGNIETVNNLITEVEQVQQQTTENIETVNNLITEVEQIEQQIIDEVNMSIGDLTTLTTDNKSSLVNAINEVNTDLINIEGYIGYTDNDIYGVEVDVKNNRFTRLAGAVGKNAGADFDNIRAFGGRRRCILTDDGKVLAYYGESAYTETGALTQEVIKNGVTYPVGTHVQVMVEQPKFYYRVVPLELERIEYKEINTLTITSGATASGDVTVNLDGVNYTVPIIAGDTTTTVATKIRSNAYNGWTTGGTGAVVIFMANTIGERVTATFNGGSTGVTATVVKTLSGKLAKGYHLRKARYYVSDYEKAGFKLHPAFIVNGVEKEYVYLSAFEGSLYDVSAGTYILDDAQVAEFDVDKLCSIANAKPISGLTQLLTRPNVRKLAQNRGTGWQQAYVMTISATQMLFLIEYASFNMQTAIGIGVTNKVSGTGNESELTGDTTILGNASGSVTNANGFNVVTYRGEENFWGNIFKWADGMNIYAYGEHSLFVADNSFGDNISTAPYKDTELTISRTNGYVSAFAYNEEFDWLFIPSETIGNSSLPVGDYFYQNHTYNGWLVARLGGYWAYGSSAGGFCWSVYNASSDRARAIGGRLVYIPS